MQVYLVRHGEALDQTEDSARPLSIKGEANIRLLSELLSQRFKIIPGHIYHSPRLRAAQTASIISENYPLTPAQTETEGLSPMDDPNQWAERLEMADKDTMLVGHLPHLSRLASLLLLSDPNREILNFTPGTALCLEKASRWRVRWMISPDILKTQ